MYFYYGNEHYYLTRIFLNDETLKDAAYGNGLTHDYDKLAYALANNLYKNIESLLIDTDLSAEEFYAAEFEKYLNNKNVSSIITGIQDAVYATYEIMLPWYLVTNKGFYVAVLKSALYGSIKHFFYKHRDKYLPQYDWYLIEQNPKRKAIMEMLFREFDKLTNVTDALRYYQDPDDIPLKFIIYLQEITGFTMNTYDGLFNDKQLRSLTKHLIEVWREKGSNFSIELFFACMGIECDIKELWFDSRRYYDPDMFNSYTNVRNVRSFGYYLIPHMPHFVSYEYSAKSVFYSDYTNPKSSRMWDYKVSQISQQEQDVKLRQLLGLTPGEEGETYTFFKSNFLLLNFSYIGRSKIIYQKELNVYKELLQYILPVYIRAYYGNEYESLYGNDEVDVLASYDLGDPPPYSVIDKDGNERPSEPFQLFDTAVGIPSNITDYVPIDKVGRRFVSGTYINVYDCRYSQYLTNNGIFTLTEDTEINPEKTYFIMDDGNPRVAAGEELDAKNLFKLYEKKKDFSFSGLVSSPNYDVISGAPKSATGLIDFPLYSDGKHEYVLTDADELTKEDGTVGQLVIEEEIDDRDDIPESSKALAHYYFKVNSEKTEIYPNLFADGNNYSYIVASDNQVEFFESNFDSQINDWDKETFDQKYTNNPLNLFETSSWRTDIDASNELYDGNTWNGYVQYPYSQYTNPLEFVEANLDNELTITLI